ncbi:MAG: hypothetical protein ABIK07_15715 [Planctomycetota bacterium]
MTKEELSQISEVKENLASLASEIREQNKTLFEMTKRHDQALYGSHEYPGLGTRVAILEKFKTSGTLVVEIVIAVVAGLLANTFYGFTK